MSRADQDHRMREALIRLQLISHGTTQAWNSASGHGGSNENVYPAGGDRDNLVHKLASKYDDTAPDDTAGRERIIAEAIELRASIAKGTTIETTPQTRDELDQDIRRKLADGWTDKEIANAMKLTPTRVRVAVIDDAHDKVLELAHEGRTVRYIALTTGVSKSSVHRILKRAA